MYRQIARCRACGNPELAEVLDLGVQALTGVFPQTRTQEITSGPLRLVKCAGGSDACGLVQLEHTYDLGELYGMNYGYRSGLNASMVEHLHGKVRRILGEYLIERSNEDTLVIDIGSNDSTTLQAYPQQGYTLVGFDPTGIKFSKHYPPHIQLVADFFSSALFARHFGTRRAQIVTSFSMFYDLEQPLTFMREVRDVLADEGVWVFEQSYLPIMLAKNSYDTVCHEHLEYYALEQIRWMTARAGLKIVDVEFNDVNGGSFSVTAAREESARVVMPSVGDAFAREAELGIGELATFRRFARRVEETRDRLRQFLDRARSRGELVGALGASTKGNVLLQYCGISERDIAKIGEVNEEKFGRYSPGSLIPICPESELLALKPDYLVVLPWHFRNFFVRQPQLAGTTLVFPLPEIESLKIVH